MMGNPCEANWPGFKNYVIARLPQLQFLDGEAITRSMQIIAKQQLPKLAVELRSLAQEKRDEKAAEGVCRLSPYRYGRKAPYTPEVRYTAILRSRSVDGVCRRGTRRHDHRIGAHEDVRGARRGEGREGEPRAAAPAAGARPRGRTAQKVERVRQREEEGKILQCNEGKWEFHFDEESVKGSIILDCTFRGTWTRH